VFGAMVVVIAGNPASKERRVVKFVTDGTKRTSLKRLMVPLAFVFVALMFVAVATIRWDIWIGNLATQTTDDANVRAETTRLSTRVSGVVQNINVNDFQHVTAGQLLVQVDPADYEAEVAQAAAVVAAAKAALDNLANQVELQYATIAQAEAQRASALALEVEAWQEQERQASLANTDAGTRQKLEQAVAAYGKAQADVKASAAVIAQQQHQLEVLAGTKQQRAADLLAAKAALTAATLRLGYTRIVAPFDGVVGERQVQLGDYVNIGSSLLNVVPLPNVYVIANYKETQLTHVTPGQSVEIIVDTFPEHALVGFVRQISPSSGSQVALLPPDNATGNFTKVVQRIPVRIEFEQGQPFLKYLLPGMSATTRIHTDTVDLPIKTGLFHGPN
jgi:membrane fusion protein, multidrug efflux system